MSATAFGPANRLDNFTTNSWLFPPETREVQFDEKWAFVIKKEKHRDPDDPADRLCGDCWDHVGFDAEQRLVVSVVPGERTAENVQKVVEDYQRRTEGTIPRLIATDEYAAYPEAILQAYGAEVVPEPTVRMMDPFACHTPPVFEPLPKITRLNTGIPTLSFACSTPPLMVVLP